MKIPKALIACEESQRVCIAMRENGIDCYSCDILPCSGGHPEWHFQRTIFDLIQGQTILKSQAGNLIAIPERWDLIIAHPPCTYLTVTGNRWFDVEKYGQKAIERQKLRYQAIVFFMEMVYANADRIAVENPIGIMNTAYKNPDQIIEPFMFGDPYKKSTCLWLKNLHPLVPSNIVEIDRSDYYEYVSKSGKIKHDSKYRSKCSYQDRSSHRSKTFPGIAKAMADQWGGLLLEEAET